MTKLARPCLTCGRPTQGSRCPEHGSTTARGYGSSWQRLRQRAIDRVGYCEWCGHKGTPDNPLTADHIVAKSLGGADTLDNLQCLCRRCNSAKGWRLVDGSSQGRNT